MCGTVEGYRGSSHWLSVAVANLASAILKLLPELPGEPFEEPLWPLLDTLEFLLARLPRTPPRTAATMTTMRTGTPILIQLLMPRFFAAGWGVMYPVDSA